MNSISKNTFQKLLAVCCWNSLRIKCTGAASCVRLNVVTSQQMQQSARDNNGVYFTCREQQAQLGWKGHWLGMSCPGLWLLRFRVRLQAALGASTTSAWTGNVNACPASSLPLSPESMVHVCFSLGLPMLLRFSQILIFHFLIFFPLVCNKYD